MSSLTVMNTDEEAIFGRYGQPGVCRDGVAIARLGIVEELKLERHVSALGETPALLPYLKRHAVLRGPLDVEPADSAKVGLHPARRLAVVVAGHAEGLPIAALEERVGLACRLRGGCHQHQCCGGE